MSTARRWAKACGCGCGLLTIVGALLGVGGYYYIRAIVREAGQAEAAMERVREEHGGVADFRPDPDGGLGTARVEAFLHARKLMVPARTETEGALALLSGGGPEEGEVPGVVGELLEWGMGAMRVGAATELLPQVIGFVTARGEALLEAGMGPGEYLYLYSLVYYSWLGKSPADGPGFPLVSGDEDGSQQHRGEPDEFDVREGRREEVLRHLNTQLLPALRRQLEALDAQEQRAEADPWRKELAAEIAAMEEDPFRIPWRDGLPARIQASLRPFRARLASSYSSECNPLEVLAGTGK